jgi:hypothetical protein
VSLTNLALTLQNGSITEACIAQRAKIRVHETKDCIAISSAAHAICWKVFNGVILISFSLFLLVLVQTFNFFLAM